MVPSPSGNAIAGYFSAAAVSSVLLILQVFRGITGAERQQNVRNVIHTMINVLKQRI